MQPTPRYFLLDDGQRTGPHSLAVLKQKAEMGFLTRDNLIAPENDPEAWAPLKESQVLCEELIPARPHYTLGKREVEKVNHAGNPEILSVDQILRGNLARQQQAESELLKTLPPVSNRRRNDCLLLLIIGNLLIGLAYYFLRHNPMAAVSLLGVVALYNTGVVWILFFVMDRY